MDTAEAFQVVLDLAKQNMCDQQDMPDEHARQQEAINQIEDLAVNHFGDD